MKIIKVENLVFVISILILTAVMYAEFSLKENMYVNEKIKDIKAEYDSKIISNDKIVNVLLEDVLNNQEISYLLYEADKGINKEENRNKLYNLYKTKYESFKKRGILQFHFHLANADSFLRFHNPEKYGDSLLFRKSIQRVINTKEKVLGFEVGKFFDGFRYIYPLFYKGEYVGSVEASIRTSFMLKHMKEVNDARYNLVLNSKFLDNIIVPSHIEKYYHKFYADNSYYAGNASDEIENSTKNMLKSIKGKISNLMKKEKAFLVHADAEDGKIYVFTFIPLFNVNADNVGYFFSIKEDGTIHKIAIIQIIKYIIALILFSIILYFYKQNRNKTITIEQLNNAIDKTTLVSKTDLKGKITYVNDAFEKLSGYSKKELLGKSHNIIRDPNTPKEIFKDMWETIKSKKSWHGTITNLAKNGTNYTVDATIFPILNVDGRIIEYIAIRHDITEVEEYKKILKEQLDDTTKSLEDSINYTKQYEEAINSSTAVLKTDTNNIITYVNEQFCKLSGYKKEELIGINCKNIRHDNHVKMGECESIAKRIKNREVVSLVFTNIAKDGTYFFLDTLIYPIVNREEKVVEHLHLMHDISEIINLHQELEDTQKEIIYKMGEIGETRSKETGNHVKRVAEYSRLLGILYGLEDKEAEMLKLASPMHDIGKVGIPDSVLKKPGKLDEEEWEVMKSHAELGYEMLKHSSRPILKAAATVAGEHHEKWNGSGYPKGLKGEEIHIYGRITAVADVFDALGSDRCYKKAWELDKILKLFEEEKGKHFEPKLVEIFFDNLDKFLEIRDKFKD